MRVFTSVRVFAVAATLGLISLSALSEAGAGEGAACTSDGACNPGSTGSELRCERASNGIGKCVPGCNNSNQCRGNRTCALATHQCVSPGPAPGPSPTPTPGSVVAQTRSRVMSEAAVIAMRTNPALQTSSCGYDYRTARGHSGSGDYLEICRDRSAPKKALDFYSDLEADCDGDLSNAPSSDICRSEKTVNECWYVTDPKTKKRVRKCGVRQLETSYHPAGGGALDPTAIPFFVLPKDLRNGLPASASPDIRKGQLGMIIVGNSVVYAIFGDAGPDSVLGEASARAIRALGFPGNPHSTPQAPAPAGLGSGVLTVVFEGEENRIPELTALTFEMIQRKGAEAAARWLASCE